MAQVLATTYWNVALGKDLEFIEANKIKVEYAPTLSHRGNGFTKAMKPAKFLAAREMMGRVDNS